jgi:hypothetical protein
MTITTALGEVLTLRVLRMLLQGVAIAATLVGTVEIRTGTVLLTMVRGLEPSMRPLLQEVAPMMAAVVAEAAHRLPVRDLQGEAGVDQGINFSTNPFYA